MAQSAERKPALTATQNIHSGAASTAAEGTGQIRQNGGNARWLGVMVDHVSYAGGQEVACSDGSRLSAARAGNRRTLAKSLVPDFPAGRVCCFL